MGEYDGDGEAGKTESRSAGVGVEVDGMGDDVVVGGDCISPEMVVDRLSMVALQAGRQSVDIKRNK